MNHPDVPEGSITQWDEVKNIENVISKVTGSLTINYVYGAANNLLMGRKDASGTGQNFFAYDGYGNVKNDWSTGAAYVYNDASQLRPCNFFCVTAGFKYIPPVVLQTGS